MANSKNIHPDFREIEIITTSGKKFKTRSTYRKSDTLKLEIDPETHPAWTKKAGYVNTKADEVSKFNNRFAGLSILNKNQS